MNKVHIIHMGWYIKVKFQYDSKLVKVMKLFQCRYNVKDKLWFVDKDKVGELKEELHILGYKILESGEKQYSVTKKS